MSYKIEEIELSLLSVSPENIRKRYPRRNIEFLKRSIKHKGVQIPLVVRKVEDRYEIISGQRRFLAVQDLNAEENLGIKTLPCIVRELTDEEANDLSLMDDLLHVTADPRDKGASVKKSLLIKGNIEDVADAVGQDTELLNTYVSTLAYNPSQAEIDKENNVEPKTKETKPKEEEEEKEETSKEQKSLPVQEKEDIEKKKTEPSQKSDGEETKEKPEETYRTRRLPWVPDLKDSIFPGMYTYAREQVGLSQKEAIDRKTSELWEEYLKKNHYLF